MKNFNELLEDASIVSDHRTKIFNQLIEKVKTEILPKFCISCNGFGLTRIYFKFETQIISDTESKFTGVDEFPKFCISIDVKNKTISDCNYQPCEGYCNDDDYQSFEDCSFTKIGILVFIRGLNSRLEAYNKKYTDLNAEAEDLLNK